MTLPLWEVTLRLLIAVAIGILFGWQRNRDNKPVGARTHILIALAACITALISAYGYESTAAVYSNNINLNSDPARLMVGILTGIGFIGAGIIWKEPGGSVTGITTAAGIFLLAVLGLAAGLGLYFLTAVGTGISFLTLLAGDISASIKCRKKKSRDKDD